MPKSTPPMLVSACCALLPPSLANRGRWSLGGIRSGIDDMGGWGRAAVLARVSVGGTGAPPSR